MEYRKQHPVWGYRRHVTIGGHKGRTVWQMCVKLGTMPHGEVYFLDEPIPGNIVRIMEIGNTQWNIRGNSKRVRVVFIRPEWNHVQVEYV
jgi:hypothetical protein